MRKIIFGIVLTIPLLVFGQTSNPIIITWQANNYFPADFVGKAAATPNAPIIVSAELVQNGKLADLSKAEIKWFVDDSITATGAGIKTMSFAAKQGVSQETVRISITLAGKLFENSVRIPVIKPTITVISPLSGKEVKAGERADFQAIPFFFNVDSLKKISFVWQVNNQTVASDGNKLSLKIGTPQTGYDNSILISVTAQNSDNPYEFNRESMNLSIIK